VDEMASERKVGIVGLVVLLILVGVPLVVSQASYKIAEAVPGERAMPPEADGITAPSDSAMLLVAGIILLTAGILVGQILRLKPAEESVSAR
jgi:hypothetical protein